MVLFCYSLPLISIHFCLWFIYVFAERTKEIGIFGVRIFVRACDYRVSFHYSLSGRLCVRAVYLGSYLAPSRTSHILFRFLS